MHSIIPACLQLKILNTKIGNSIPLPSYATAGSAGLDLHACIDKAITFMPDQCELIATGIACFIGDPKYAGFIFPRSGLGHKKGIVLGNLVGIIDSDYQGELMISCWNRSQSEVTITPGERIAQYVIMPVEQRQLAIVKEFSVETTRGAGGFGHTGN